MKNLMLGIALSLGLIACSEKTPTQPSQTTQPTQPAVSAPAAQKQATATADLAAGKAIAERVCKACHGANGGGIAPGIPHLAAQRERYLLTSLNEYKEGKRQHAALRDMTATMSDADLRNVAGYYASLPPVAGATAKDVQQSSAYVEGKELAKACAKCHGEDGNSKAPGTPTLAGQQPHYLVMAIQEYHQGDRKAATMKSMLSNSSTVDLEKLALYFASQTPTQRGAPSFGDPVAGEPTTAMCGGCHGAQGVSHDAATPSLAGQDPRYLVSAIKAYRNTRKNWGMQRYVSALGDKEIENIVAYYAIQKPKAADDVPTSGKELAEKCNRCHDNDNNPTMTAPKMNGQDKDYLTMALRSYRDGKRESSLMHNMSYAYSNALIEDISSWYARQPAK